MRQESRCYGTGILAFRENTPMPDPFFDTEVWKQQKEQYVRLLGTCEYHLQEFMKGMRILAEYEQHMKTTREAWEKDNLHGN